MPDVTVVVLTGFADIFHQFQTSVFLHEPDAHVVVIRSRNVDLGEGRCPCCQQPLRRWPGDWDFRNGVEPFIFSRNVNIGMRAAGRDDVFLVNDDVTWTRPDCLKDLMRVAHSSPEIGLLSPLFLGNVGNPLQSTAYAEPRLAYSEAPLYFTGVYIKRSTIDRVGLLDEGFDGYGSEDDEYCHRVRKAGLKLAITPEVVMRHGFGRSDATASFTRTMTEAERMESAEKMYRRYQEKCQQTASR